MENSEKKIIKTHFVRDVLERIGAFDKNCPDDWRQQVIQALQNEGIQMHPNAIYGVRQRAMNKMKQLHRVLSRKKQHGQDALFDSRNSKQLTIADLLAFQQFSKSFGGIDKVKNAIRAMEALIQ